MSSLTFQTVALSDDSDDFPLYLLTLQHPTAGTLRFVNDNENIVSGGNTYHARVFSIAVADDSPALSIDNNDGQLDSMIDISGARNIAANIKMVLRSTPSVTEFEFDFESKSAGRNAEAVSLKLSSGLNLEGMAIGRIRFTKAVAPGLF